MRLLLLIAAIAMVNITSAQAFVPNGDFETGDLSGYRVQEDFADVPSSPLVNNVPLSAQEHVAEIKTGFTDFGVTTATLAKDFGTIPSDVKDLLFDVRFTDVGEDNPPIFALAQAPEFQEAALLDLDNLLVVFESDAGKKFVMNMNSTGFDLGSGASTEELSNGFTRVKINISGFVADNSTVYFDLRDGDDFRLSKVQIDNIDLLSENQAVAPEPTSMFLIGSGLAGVAFLRKKKMV